MLIALLNLSNRSSMALTRRRALILVLALWAGGILDADQALLCLAYANAIVDRAFLPSQSAMSRSHLRRPRFSLAHYSEYEFKCLSRFHKAHIPELLDFFNICADGYKTSWGTHSTNTEALCIVLFRLAHPGSWGTLTHHFGVSESHLSSIFSQVIDQMLFSKGDLLHRLPRYYTRPHNLRKFARAIWRKGQHFTNCVAFIDGTCRRVARPKYHQQTCYSGYKRFHCIKFQHIVFPDGIIAFQHGPFAGRHADMYLWNETRIAHILETHFRFTIDDDTLASHVPLNGPMAPLDAHHRLQYCFFGDGGYIVRHPGLMMPFRHTMPPLTPVQINYNRNLSRCREAVEWAFGKIVNNFSYLDQWKQQKIWLRPAGKYYKAATLLTNVHTCLYNSQTAQFFGVVPPTLAQYKAMADDLDIEEEAVDTHATEYSDMSAEED